MCRGGGVCVVVGRGGCQCYLTTLIELISGSVAKAVACVALPRGC